MDHHYTHRCIYIQDYEKPLYRMRWYHKNQDKDLHIFHLHKLNFHNIQHLLYILVCSKEVGQYNLVSKNKQEYNL